MEGTSPMCLSCLADHPGRPGHTILGATRFYCPFCAADNLYPLPAVTVIIFGVIVAAVVGFLGWVLVTTGMIWIPGGVVGGIVCAFGWELISDLERRRELRSALERRRERDASRAVTAS